jgi:ATP-dependent metalloprotease
MSRQLSVSSLHAGQLRYHDFAKLRELYALGRASHYSTVARDTGIVRASGSKDQSIASAWKADVGPMHNTTRSFLTFGSSASSNPFTQLLRTQQLKRLESAANAAPQDGDTQYRFLYELAQDHPSAVIARIRHPAFKRHALNSSAATLYLQLLQKTNQVSQLDVDDILQRVSRGLSEHEYAYGLTPDVLHSWKSEVQEKKLSKADQAQQLLRLFMSGGGAAAVTGASAALGSAGGVMNGGAPMAMLQKGLDPKNPIHVQLTSATPSIRGMIGSALKTVFIVSIGFACIGALLDDKGIGRGMGGMNSNSKHVQEAEQDGRKVKFEDVKGVEEAKAELEEIVMYLKDPSKFTRLGGKLPRGLLLTGPPGTGKTLLAKAIAGEADVPFFYSSGSQFEEVYVGLGAKRIRELFEAAKKKAPAIIFIDEIDAVGGTRRLKDQSALKMTLNELLVQLDGFDENNGIIVIGATNFMESLDEALLRPGRFDKHVSVPLPDVGGRKEILEMYAKKTKLSKDVDLNILARGTTGFSGADLFNLMNQAALKASVDGLNAINMTVLEFAKDKILMGAERKTAVITAETARCTAYHEAGHALVAVLTEGATPIHKATIMPRGSALGMVTMLPEGDQTSQSLKQMLAFLDVAMGGRVAEELIFGKPEVTSGASSDILNATRVARNMVTKFGFSDEVGIVFHGGNNGEESASAETRARIDSEVKKLTEQAYKRAKDLLSRHSVEHKLLAETLLEYETLTGDEVRALVKRREKPKRPVINKTGGSRGDTSIITGNTGNGRGKSRLPGLTKEENERRQ